MNLPNKLTILRIILVPFCMFFIAFNFSGMLGLYWTFQALLGLLQAFILSRVMPLPKFTENQQSYKTMVGGHHTVLAIPKTCRDTDYVGRIVEVLSAETWKTVTPTFYEIALKTRYLRDSESKEVLDIVLDQRYFDFGFVYDASKGASFIIQDLINNNKDNILGAYVAAMTARQFRPTLKELDELITKAREDMERAAKSLDFMAAMRYRDRMYELQKMKEEL